MTTSPKQRYIQDNYMGVPIKCNAGYPSFENIIQALYVLVYGATETLRHPRGYHVRTRFTDKMSPAEYSANINNYYRKKSNYLPLRVTVIENDETGVHHHHAVILNDKKDKKASLQHIHAKLKHEGKLADYSVIGPDHDAYGHHLQSLEDLDSFFKWMTYLAKIKSKPNRHQLWSGSRKVTSLLKQWRKNGKPNLRLAKQQTLTEDPLEDDLGAFVGL